MINFDLEIRKKIKAAAIGEAFTMPYGQVTEEYAKQRAQAFSRAKKCPIVFLDGAPAGHIAFKRVTPEEANPVLYPEMDCLKIGESHLYELPTPMHQRVRMSASVRNRRGEVLLSCTKEAGGLRVTRHPLTAEEIKRHGLLPEKQKTSKHGLERLETEREITLHPQTYAEIRALRVAVSNKGQLTGWKLTCRVQDDGSVLVTRLDKEIGHAR